MKRSIVVALALALVPAAQAQLYKYVDKDGKTVYTDQPPANADSKSVNVQHGSAPAPEKSAVERDKALDKGRKEARAKEEKSAKSMQRERELEQRCSQARIAFQHYSDGGRIYKYEKGERVFLSDAELEAERDRARREMEEACKKG